MYEFIVFHIYVCVDSIVMTLSSKQLTKKCALYMLVNTNTLILRSIQIKAIKDRVPSKYVFDA